MSETEPGGAAGPAPDEDLADLYENAPCGYLSMRPDGRIFKANATLAGWMGCTAAELTSRRLPDLLTIGTRIFYETHGAPLLRLQGHVDELALELKTLSGQRMPVFASGVEHADAAGRRTTRLTFFKAAQRRRWEQELIEARRATEHLLQAELDTASLREQFIAVLGHDLRNPLASIGAGMSLLRRRHQLGPEAIGIVDLVQASVNRMAALIDDVLDFARGRLGGGAPLNLVPQLDLAPVLDLLVAELRLAAPARTIETRFALDRPVRCDPSRLGQLVSNLLGNALTHGAQDAPVRLAATTGPQGLVLAVCNQGGAIPPAAMERLFQPFVRGEVRDNQQGLGLGLYIAAEIARAHGGTLDVSSSAQETCFTFRMPATQGQGDTGPDRPA